MLEFGHLFTTCKYNWLHRYPHDKIEDHEENCPYKPEEKADNWFTGN